MSRPSSSAARRLFFALWPTPPVRVALAEVVDDLRRRCTGGGRWVRPARFHVTLQFLGDFAADCSERALSDAVAAGDAVTMMPFALSFDHVARFSRHRAPWWLGVTQTPEPLNRLWTDLGAALRQRGLRVECGPYVPHLTIRRDPPGDPPAVPVAPVTWPVDHFVLIDSQLAQDTAYVEIARWPR
ncbi:RNA 2',3'-cyclic phosphodiesterase [Tahibacter amnicola]|uniref:RNA 2',3'-cyclic phosphodiesterase n=1 Tax=Tahibacter amnicola TaxID=2976241 RepID=A0ABY6BG67_9GAMM|nr:RNA 2',3'-cyclic phosphodiesterase [Tahibacter amnicola]UXI67601.1 RNA 2',3'-cyclic phosphodiesterase [Tahibacter amnicola]